MVTTQTLPMSEQDYRECALGDTAGQWELVDGQRREKPAMTAAHGRVMMDLVVILARQLDPSEYALRAGHARLRVSPETYYVPDVVVIPTVLEDALLAMPNELDAYGDPLPLVVEIWSPSTGRYDIERKLPGYQRRGDLEIWYIDPREGTLTAWRRQPDGTYGESVFRGGTVRPASLASVAVDLDALLARTRR